MRFPRLLLALPLVALPLAHASDAAACGACVISEGESTVVTGHRMILSTSQQGTTLWDQISYSGDPSSFAWVLPIKGTVDVGLSSDALFQVLEGNTQVYISSPIINCPPPPNCDGAVGAPTSDSGGGGEESPVEVLAQETVGPYETVQLASSDPNALNEWLGSHGYVIPPDLAPVIGSYVAEGFNFLALKLVPGQGVESMRPVRVTTPGASATLPLRMVAGGTGAITPITLWVLGEGRYEPTNFPSFQIEREALVWDWDNSRSNYTELKTAGFEATNGFGWLMEAGEQTSLYSIEYPLMDLVNYDVASSGYGDPVSGEGATEELQADLERLYGGIPESTLWVSRMSAELSRAALTDDLDLGVSADQSYVNRYLEAQTAVGTAPECPPVQQCDPWQFPGSGDGIDPPRNPDVWGGSGTCAMSPGAGGSAALGGLAVAAALALTRRRRRG
ncbi:MAG TPA: DUF2330 domain-containing protein [Candidatus Nanopelagicales bacterium]|nr:DUF2330 domain-containing protein [Candidatus Nanopelagicales bacterium]